jgi:hypothetical protein
MLPQQRLRDYARGVRPEYRQAARATVRLESLGRRQVSFIGPPAPVLFYEPPGLSTLPLTADGACVREGLGCASADALHGEATEAATATALRVVRAGPGSRGVRGRPLGQLQEIGR